MCLASEGVDPYLRVYNLVRLYCLDKQLDYLSLLLEPTHVSVVDHHCEGLLHDLSVEELVEVSGRLWTLFQNADEGVHTLQSELHQLWLLVLH